jgi:N-acetylmuramic acid 6-phosphate etherase
MRPGRLKRRAETMVSQIAHCDPSQAASSLDQSQGEIKTAVLLALGIDKVEAETILKKCAGNLRRVLPSSATDKVSSVSLSVRRLTPFEELPCQLAA